MTMQSPQPVLPLIPESAPFTSEQRSWLNGFFAGILSLDAGPRLATTGDLLSAGAQISAAPADDGAPWHDPSIELPNRMALAEGKPLSRRMMAAMAQQDCGQCGYNCENYAKAIFEQAEPRLNLCVPGGKATSRMLKNLVEEMGGGVVDPATRAAADTSNPASESDVAPGYSRDKPVQAKLAGRYRLNAESSEKCTNHIDIDLTGTGLAYVAGDSLGVVATNDAALVDQIIAAIKAPADFPIGDKTFRQALIEDASLSPAPDGLLQLVSYLVGGDRRRRAQALAKGEDPDGDAETLDVLGVLEKFPGLHPDPEAFYECLESLQPRLYSISSSPLVDPNRVSLTVDTVRYDVGSRQRLGVASTFLGERLELDQVVGIYVQKAHGFALPKNGAIPIIMVGPGTGIAPFRAFLQDRKASGASGGNWLFYGHQRETTDFFYRDELNAMLTEGTLTRLSTAWSRDGANKVYVQDKMRAEGAELWQWLQRGAHFYICGDAKRMARDVETALADVISIHGGLSLDDAKANISAMKQTGRYQADVY